MAGVEVWVERSRRTADLGRFRVKRMGGDGSKVVAVGGGSGAVRGRRVGGRLRRGFGAPGGWGSLAFRFAEEFELLALEPQGFVPLFAAAQGESHFDQILHDEDPAVEGDLGRLLHILDHLSEHGCKRNQEVFAGDVGEGRPGGLLGKVADVFDAGAIIEPLLVGALPPFGEILFSNEPVLEEPFHVMSHHRIAVEPIQDVFGGDVVHDLMIQLLADVERQSGYLTSVRSHLISGSWFVVNG